MSDAQQTPRNLAPRPAADAGLDLLTLGECMVRLSPPGHQRIELTPVFEAYAGGGEYNVSYALARYGMRTGWVSALVDNPLGHFIRNHARAAGHGHRRRRLGAVRRSREGGPRRPEFHRSGDRRARERVAVRPRAHRRLAHETRRRGLGEALLAAPRPVVPHRGDLQRTERVVRRNGARRRYRPPTDRGPSPATTSTSGASSGRRRRRSA